MSVQKLIVALQNLESNPSLANAGVTRRITLTETVNVQTSKYLNVLYVSD